MVCRRSSFFHFPFSKFYFYFPKKGGGRRAEGKPEKEKEKGPVGNTAAFGRAVRGRLADGCKISENAKMRKRPVDAMDIEN